MAYRTRKCASRRKASRRNTFCRKARRGGGELYTNPPLQFRR